MVPQNSFHFRIEFPRFDVTLCERGKKLLECHIPVGVQSQQQGQVNLRPVYMDVGNPRRVR